MKTAFVFPGQGSQKVGMLQDLYNAYPIVKQRFEEADEALGYSISKLCFEGPDTELVKTANTQPAILTASVACYEILKEQGFMPDIVGGHSLGRTPTTSRVFEINNRKIHIFVSKGCPKDRIQALEQVGAQVTVVESISTRKSKSTDIVIDIK
ncbi:MAG: acyltransferase domain-containing protein, partial [Veillonella parvula]